MERSVEVDTGESVAFHYDLAGLGSRFLAVLIDISIQIAIVVAVFAVFAVIVSLVGAPARAIPGKLRALSGSLFEALLILSAFLLFFGYFIAFEFLWRGSTPGKRIVGIRVVRDGGFPLDFVGSLVRNLVRILELALGFYLVSAISTLLSPLNRRLGDYAAGTIVVRDARYERTARLAGARENDPLMRDLDASERDVIRRFCERSPSLVPGARGELAAEIAARIRPKLAAPFDHLEDQALLEHLAEILSARA